MIKLFSEKVKPTFTNSDRNILQVENFEEVFFDVYEFEINGNKYPVEKISEYNGNPVVLVPVEREGSRASYPFVLVKGSPEIIFNTNSSGLEYLGEVKEEESNDLAELLLPEKELEYVPFLEDKKEEILREIKNAKKLALTNAKKEIAILEEQKLKHIEEEAARKEEALTEYLKSARESLVEEFIRISNKIKDEINLSNDKKITKIDEKVDNKVTTIAEGLSKSLKKDFTTYSKQFDKAIRVLVKELYSLQIEPRIDDELKQISLNLDTKVSVIEKSLDDKLEVKADKVIVEDINREVHAIRDTNIELNNSLNKGVQKALSRIGNVDRKVESLNESIYKDLDKRVAEVEIDVRDYYDERLKVLEEKTFDINEESRKYFVNLIQESRDNLISEIRQIKNEKPVEYIIEANGKKQIKDFDSFRKDFDKQISDKITTEIAHLKKYISMYSSGGGSVAAQFADGGIMNGNLTVVGSISATETITASAFYEIDCNNTPQRVASRNFAIAMSVALG